MSVYSPPIEDVAIFDTALFSAGDTLLTQSAADRRYLRFPNAQGTETLQNTNVNGTLAVDQMSAFVSGEITTSDRIYQELGSTSYNAVNGYYGLAKDAYPALNPYSNGYKAVSTWTTRTIPTPTLQYRGIAWSPELGLFAAVSQDGTGNRVMTSPNGITWTSRTTPTVPDEPAYQSITWSRELGLFCAVANAGTGNRVATSPDGITWTARSTTGFDNVWRSVTWAPELGLFCAVASTGTGNRVMTSPNGTTWTTRDTTGKDQSWNNIVWAAELGLFVVVSFGGGANSVMTSPDGINWTLLTLTGITNAWLGICWSPELGLFVATAASGTGNRVMTSPDGINWTSRTSAADLSWANVIWAAELGLFVACSDTAGTTSVMISADGVNWSLRTCPANQWRALAWAPELGIIVVVTTNASTPKVITSSLAARPPTSYNVFDSSFNSIDQNGNWTLLAKEIDFNSGTGTASLQMDPLAPANFEIVCSGDLELKPTGSIDCNGKTINMTGGEIHNCPLVHSQNNNDIIIEGKGTGDVILKTNNVNRITVDDTGVLTSTGRFVLNTTLGNPSSTASLTLTDTASTNSMLFVVNANSTNYNSIVQLGDQVIAATPQNTEALVLTSNSTTTTSGVRITATSALIGAGGTTAAPTAALSFSGSTITPTGNFAATTISVATGGTNNNALVVADSGSSGALRFSGNSAVTTTYPIIQATDSFIAGFANTNGSMCLTAKTTANVYTGIRIDSAGTTIGFGGTGTAVTPTNSVVVNTSGVTVKPKLIFPDASEQTTAFSQPAVTVISGNTTLSNPTFFDTTYMVGGAYTIDLPSAGGANNGFIFKFRATASGTKTLQRNTRLVDYQTVGVYVSTITFTYYCDVVSDGTYWYVLNKN